MSTPTSNGVQTGRIKMFNDSKGFGFIIPDDGSEELFFHRTDLAGPERRDAPAIHTHVEYQSGVGARGPKATKVRPVST